MLLRVCVGWSCSLNNLWRCVQKNLPPPCERFPGEAPQVRSTLSRWTPGSSGYPAGRRRTADERGFYQAEDSFWIFMSECMFVCLCMFLLRLSFGDICVCFAPWEWCRAWRLLQAETTRRLSWSECGDDTSVNLRRTRPGGDEMVLLGDFKMKKQRKKRNKWGRSDRLRA